MAAALSEVITKMMTMLGIWKNKEPEISKQNPILYYTNEVFKHILNEYTWYFYGVSVVVIFLCVCYYVRGYKRRAEMRRQHEEMQRVGERTTQRRRPGAIYRDHEIFRNVVQTVHEYTNPEDDNLKDSEKSQLRQRTHNASNDERPAAEEGNN